MFNWQSLNTTYLYDGTIEGLFTIVFDSFLKSTIPAHIIEENKYEENFLQKPIKIETDYTKAERIEKGILKNISYDVLYHSHYAFLCEEMDKELAILKYLLQGFHIGPRIHNMLSIDYVFDIHRMRKKAFGECHRLKGLVRFCEIENHLWYSKVHPDNNILEPLGHHFMRRLPQESFMLHDQNHNKLFLYHQGKYQIVEGNNFIIPSVSQKEMEFQELWKIFFQTISIKERSNPRLQMQYMPKKYWQDLVESPLH